MLVILADQCINRDVRDALRTLSNVTLTYTGDVKLATATDEDIFEYARKNGCIILTFDKDFGDTRIFEPKKTAGMVIVYVENFGRESLIRETKEFFERRTPKSLHGKGFIIEPGRVRFFGSD